MIQIKYEKTGFPGKIKLNIDINYILPLKEIPYLP